MALSPAWLPARLRRSLCQIPAAAKAGIAGSVPELHALTVRTVSQAINLALDKPGFLAATSPRP